MLLIRAQLSVPLQQKLRKRFQCPSFAPEQLERRECALGQLLGNLSRLLQAHNGRIRRLLRFRIFARCFAELLTGLRHIQDIVDNLEGQTHVVAELCERFQLCGRTVSAHAAQTHRAAKQCGCFPFMNVAQLLHRSFLAFTFQVRYLPGYELQRTGSVRHLQDNFLMGIPRPSFALRRNFKCLGQQRVPSQHGDAVAEDFMVRQFTAAIIVIVHGGQIIVDQRIRVDALDRTGQRHGIRLASATRRRGRQA